MGALMRGLRLVLAASLLVAVAPSTAGRECQPSRRWRSSSARSSSSAMEGTTPSADLLGRIRRGEIGGVVLFGVEPHHAGRR